MPGTVIGLDVGGTSTRAVVTDLDGRALGTGRAAGARVLRSDRCSRNSSVNNTMRGSVLHHRMGWPSLNHGKMPRA